MTLLVDMNLSPEWVGCFEEAGFEARHWSNVGAATAPDEEIFEWAAQHGCAIITQDLDFPHLLYLTHAGTPSVVLLRIRDELDEDQRRRVTKLVKSSASILASGALMVVTDSRCRLRRLPLKDQNA